MREADAVVDHQPGSRAPASLEGPDAQALLCELRGMRAEIDELRAELAVIRPTSIGPSSSKAVTADVAPTTDRRSLLRHAGVAAAGAVVGGAALALGNAAPAAAADNDPLAMGAVTTSTSETELRYVGGTLSGDHVLLVQDSSNSAASSFPSMICGQSINGRAPHGVLGHTQNVGAGIVGSASGAESIAGHFIAGVNSKANLRIGTSGPVPQSRNSNGSYQAGDVVGDANDDLWLCVGGGATGALAAWRKLGGPATSGQFHVLAATTRCYDSRPGFLPNIGTKAPLTGGVDRTIDVKANGTTVPSAATAVLVNVTATNTSANGFLALFKGSIAWPGNSTLNWDHAGTNVANCAVVALAGGLIKARVGGTSTDLIIDVVGYYQ